MGLDISFFSRKRICGEFADQVNELMDLQRKFDDVNYEYDEYNEKLERYNEINDIAKAIIESIDDPTVKGEFDVTVVDNGNGDELCASFSIGNYDTENVTYFRKVNFLLPFFGYGENCSYCQISYDQVEDLLAACKTVLDAKNSEDAESVAESTLPTESGFFFGSTAYDEWYYKDVEHVQREFTNILETFDFENRELLMHCWW